MFSQNVTLFLCTYIAIIWVTLDGIVTAQLGGSHCVCPSELKVCINVVPSLSLTVTGGTSSSLAVSILEFKTGRCVSCDLSFATIQCTRRN